MIETIAIIAVGLILGGFLAIITICPEAHDESLVCWGKSSK